MPQPVLLGAFLEVEDERFDVVSRQECRDPSGFRFERRKGQFATLRSRVVRCMLISSSFGRTTWPRRDQRVGLTTFFQNSKREWSRPQGAAPCTHIPEKKGHMTQGTVKWFNGQK